MSKVPKHYLVVKLPPFAYSHPEIFMKYTYAVLIVLFLLTSNVNADTCDGLTAKQTVDCIVTNASEEDDDNEVSSSINFNSESQESMDDLVAKTNGKSGN